MLKADIIFQIKIFNEIIPPRSSSQTLVIQTSDGHKRVAITVSCPAEQDLLQLGRTTAQSGSELLQCSGSQAQAQEALVTALVTEFGRPNQLNKW